MLLFPHRIFFFLIPFSLFSKWETGNGLKFGLTRHGDTSNGVDDPREEEVVDGELELELHLNDEEPAGEDEHRVEDGQGHEELVEEAHVFHRG